MLIAASYSSVEAHDRTKPVLAGNLKIEKIWARASPKTATDGLGYVMIANSGDAPDRLIGAETPIASSTEFHATVAEGNSVTMIPTTMGIEIPGGGRAVLRPGAGHPHAMFMALRDRIEVGAPFPGTLVFEKAGRVNVTFRVVAQGANPAHAGH